MTGREDVTGEPPRFEVPPGHRRRCDRPLRALQDGQRTPGCRGSGSPPSTSGSGWSQASPPGATGCASRRQPGHTHPWRATHASTVRLASVRQAAVRYTGFEGVRAKRPPKPRRRACSGQNGPGVVGLGQRTPGPVHPRQMTVRAIGRIGGVVVGGRGGHPSRGPSRRDDRRPWHAACRLSTGSARSTGTADGAGVGERGGFAARRRTRAAWWSLPRMLGSGHRGR